MKIPPDAIIPQEKMVNYLLRPRKQDDKSRLLIGLGFAIYSPQVLEAAIRLHASGAEAVIDVKDEYGEHFVLTAQLRGLRGAMSMKSVRVRRTGETAIRFVTMYPARETS